MLGVVEAFATMPCNKVPDILDVLCQSRMSGIVLHGATDVIRVHSSSAQMKFGQKCMAEQ